MEQVWSHTPERIGEFAIVRELGIGPRGRVFLGEPQGDADPVAIAVMDPARARDRLARRRFARGIDEARRVRGQGIPGVVAADTNAPMPWVATEYVPGQTLAERVAQEGPLSQPEVLGVVADIAAALHTMHAAGVTHGELNPTCIILSPAGACVTGVGAHPQFDGSAIDDPNADGATVGFFAPEQVTEDWVGPPADVFSLGAVAYFTATGRPVFGAGNGPEVAGRLVQDEPDLTALTNPRLRGLVWDCLGKDPLGRPRADEVASFARPVTHSRPPALEVGAAAAVAASSSHGSGSEAGEGISQTATAAAGTTPTKSPATTGSREAVSAGAAAPAAAARTAGGDTTASRIRRALPVLIASALLAQLGWVAWSSRGRVEPTPSSTRTAATTAARAARPAPPATPAKAPVSRPNASRPATSAPKSVFTLFPALPLPRRSGTTEPSLRLAPLPPAPIPGFPLPVIPAPRVTRAPISRPPQPSSSPSSRPTSTPATTPSGAPTVPSARPTQEPPPPAATAPVEPSAAPSAPRPLEPAPELTGPPPGPSAAAAPTPSGGVTASAPGVTSAQAAATDAPEAPTVEPTVGGPP